MKTRLAVASALVAAVLSYLAFWPVAIEPQAWTPSPDPGFAGVCAPNEALAHVQRLHEREARGADALALDRKGRVIATLADGRVARIEGARALKTAALGGGRPLGVAHSPVGVYLLADPLHGLTGAKGRKHFTLAEQAGDAPIHFASDVVITHDNRVFLLDASQRFGFTDSYSEFLEHGATGRLVHYDDLGNTAAPVLGGLHFPGGLLESAEGDALLISETSEYRVLKYWLSGPKAGRTETFADALPGFPAHLSWNGRDTYWLALYAPRIAALDRWADRPWVRRVIARLPAPMQPHPQTRAIVVGLDRAGRVRQCLQAERGEVFAPITSVVESDGWLYLGSLTARGIGRVRAPGAGPAPAEEAPAQPEKEEDED